MMNNDNIDLMRTMQNMYPMSFNMPQFLRLPPRIANPLVPGHLGHSEGDLVENATTRIRGFKDAFIHTASDLMGSDAHSPSLPGQHAYTRGDKLEALHSKNQVLEKENIELKKQLDDISRNNSKQTHS